MSLFLPLNFHDYLANSGFYHHLEKCFQQTSNWSICLAPCSCFTDRTYSFCCLHPAPTSWSHFTSWPSLDSLLLFLCYTLLRKYLALLSSYFPFLLWYSSSFYICWNCQSLFNIYAKYCLSKLFPDPLSRIQIPFYHDAIVICM